MSTFRNKLLAEQAYISKILALTELFEDIATKCPGFWTMVDATPSSIERQQRSSLFGFDNKSEPLCCAISPITPNEFRLYVLRSLNSNIEWGRVYLTQKVFAVYSNKWVITQDVSSLSDYELSVVVDFWNNVEAEKCKFGKVIRPYRETNV